MQFNKAMYAKAFGNNKGKRVFPIRVGMQIFLLYIWFKKWIENSLQIKKSLFQAIKPTN